MGQKRKTRKKISVGPAISIGPDRYGINLVLDALLKIMNHPATGDVKIEAMRTLAALAKRPEGPITITQCSFRQGAK